ncbi:hypothetical protein VTK56DRAFT_6438 [Thermocarpiscus australiensis]
MHIARRPLDASRPHGTQSSYHVHTPAWPRILATCKSLNTQVPSVLAGHQGPQACASASVVSPKRKPAPVMGTSGIFSLYRPRPATASPHVPSCSVFQVYQTTFQRERCSLALPFAKDPTTAPHKLLDDYSPLLVMNSARLGTQIGSHAERPAKARSSGPRTTMSGPSASQPDWAALRTRFEDLYWTQDKELPEVMDIMQSLYGVVAT